MLLLRTILPMLLAASATAQPATESIGRDTTARSPIVRAVDLNRASRRTLDFEALTGEQISKLRFTNLDGEDATALLDPKEDRGKISIATAALSEFAIKPKILETRVLKRSEVMELPGGIVTADSGAAATALGWFRLTFFASPLPATWDASLQRYATNVTFGLKPPANRGANDSLQRPVSVRVSFEGLEAEPPPNIEIGGAGLDQERTFQLLFRPTTENPTLKVRSTISDVDLVLSALPRLQLEAMQGEALGLGLEEVAFSVSELQPHGALLVRPIASEVIVSVDGRGKVEPERPVLEPGAASAQFRVRTAGLGELGVTTRVGGLLAVASVQQRFPIGPLVAALIGGCLGGFARRFLKGARKRKTPQWVAEGAIVSLIAFVAGVLGVGYLGLPSAVVATEAGAFLTGAICGFVGATVLEKLSSSLARK